MEIAHTLEGWGKNLNKSSEARPRKGECSRRKRRSKAILAIEWGRRRQPNVTETRGPMEGDEKVGGKGGKRGIQLATI